MDMVQNMNKVLQDLNIKASCISANSHRHFEFYDIKLNKGGKVSSLHNNATEFAMSLKSKTNPIITPITELGVVRMKFASRSADKILFEDIISKAEIPEGVLPFLLGETDDGNLLWCDLAKNPHMLVAGTTGSGKSSLLHVIVANALRRKDVCVHISDPKSGVEFNRYRDRVASVATDYDSTLKILSNMKDIMETRYEFMSKAEVASFPGKKHIVIIDELSDLMLYDQDKSNKNKGLLERLLVTLAQKSRAAGIYLVVATQRPSVDVITGLIKANFPARLSCKVNSVTDSKVILDSPGAEALLGKGDAIIDNEQFNNVRFQIAYV